MEGRGLEARRCQLSEKEAPLALLRGICQELLGGRPGVVHGVVAQAANNRRKRHKRERRELEKGSDEKDRKELDGRKGFEETKPGGSLGAGRPRNARGGCAKNEKMK